MKTKSDLKIFVSYYKPYKWMFILDILASFIMSGLGVIYPILTREIFNTYIKNNDVKAIVVAAVWLLIIYILRCLLRLFVTTYGHVIGVKMQGDMRRDLFRKLEGLPVSYFDEHETGELMARVMNDLENVSELAHHGPENIFICSITILSTFIYLVTINWILALLLLGCVPLLALVSILTRKKQLKAFSDAKKATGEMYAGLSSSLTGIRVTKAFDNKENEMQYFEKINQKSVKARSKAYFQMGIFHSTNNLIVDLFNVVCIAGGALIVIYTNAFKIEDYLAFAVSLSLFTNPITTLVQFTEQLQDGKSGFKRFIEIMKQEEEKDKENAIKEIKLKGNVEFKKVSFKYESSEEVLKNINFNVKEGETIALVGSSGGGKTTICHLIPRFYNLSSGSISFDGINGEEISLSALRKNIGIVQQEVFLFSGSIRSNIRYGKVDANDEEIIEASKKAKIYDYIMSLPNGFDSRVGERGVKLSGGQKQRISIARVFLKNPSILILDEATSALDNTTEISIQESLNDLAKGRTSIIVAHRLSTIKKADRILVIENGKLIEEGSHKELMEKKGSYYKLYNDQFKLS